MTHLSFVSDPVEFSTLLDGLKLTKGNLSTHIKKLEDQSLVRTEKKFISRKSRTTYLCTIKGKKEIRHYLTTIESVLKNLS